jgi:hypothetical protein
MVFRWDGVETSDSIKAKEYFDQHSSSQCLIICNVERKLVIINSCTILSLPTRAL